MDVIVPCAGLSSRFPGMRPKYLLTDYSKKLMVERALMKTPGKIHIVLLREHVKMYDAEQIILDCLGDIVNIIILETPTSGPAETVYQALLRTDITGPFMVRDCDSFFDMQTVEGNVVYTSTLTDNMNLAGVAALSYIIQNDQGTITNIVEKQVVSDTFCVGAYQFASVDEYKKAYENLKDFGKELFISNIIGYMISQGHIFTTSTVTNYVNVGTLKEWLTFNDRPTIVCDLDGVVCYNQSSHGKNSYYRQQYTPIQKNVETLHKYMSRGCKIVFMTARPSQYRNVTYKMLKDLGFGDCDLVMDVNHARRIIINDFASSNPFPTCEAINIERNSDKLNLLLKD